MNVMKCISIIEIDVKMIQKCAFINIDLVASEGIAWSWTLLLGVANLALPGMIQERE